MGNWTITIQGTGGWASGDDEARHGAHELVEKLKAAGHQIESASYVHGARIDVTVPAPQRSGAAVHSDTVHKGPPPSAAPGSESDAAKAAQGPGSTSDAAKAADAAKHHTPQHGAPPAGTPPAKGKP